MVNLAKYPPLQSHDALLQQLVPPTAAGGRTGGVGGAAGGGGGGAGSSTGGMMPYLTMSALFTVEKATWAFRYSS